MKKNLLFVLILSTLVMGILAGCNRECEDCPGQPPSSDVTRPVINVITPVNDATLTGGDTIQFHANFTDNQELGQFKLEIHSADDGHTHGKGNGAAPYFEYSTIVTLTGAQSEQRLSIPIPAESAAGKYHFMVYATDKAGNEAVFQEIDLILVNPEDTLAPTVAMVHPDFTATEVDADFAVGQDTVQVVLLGTLTDTKNGAAPGDLYGYEIHFEKKGAHEHRVAGEEDRPIYQMSNYNLSGSIHNLNLTLVLRKADLENHMDYELKVLAVDRKNNRTEQSVVYHVHMD